MDIPVVQVVQFPGLWSTHAENCGFPQLQFLSRRSHAVVVHASFAGAAVAVHRWSSTPCLFAEVADVPVVWLRSS